MDIASMIVPRATWGAAPPRVRKTDSGKILDPYDRQVPSRIVLHHSWKPGVKEFHGDITIVAIQRYHQVNEGWADIGYHFLISPDGHIIYEGRPVDAIGAHCGNKNKKARVHFGNTGSIGVCLIGDYDTDQPSPQAVLTLQELFRYLEAKVGKKLPVLGHFQAATPSPKSCPGFFLCCAFGLDSEWRKSHNPPRS